MAKRANRFCVIGATLSFGDRKLLPTEKECNEHAKTLLKQEHVKRGGRPNKVYVVEIKRVWSTGEPVITGRAPNADDEVVIKEDD
jgi:hypothetical protein